MIEQEMLEVLEQKGWKKTPIGEYKTKENNQNIIKQIEGYNLYVRKTPFDEFLKNSSFSGTTSCPETPVNTGVPHVGSNAPMGRHNTHLTPRQMCVQQSSEDTVLTVSEEPLKMVAMKGTNETQNRNSSNLPELAHFSNYPSLMSTRLEKPCILIGFDSEWQNVENGRDMISWQYAVVWNENLYEFVFLKDFDKNLELNMALGCILDYLDIKSVDVRQIRRYSYCVGWDDCTKPIIKDTDNVNIAKNECVYVFRDGNFTRELINKQSDKDKNRNERTWSWFHTYLDYSVVESIKVTLLCHTGKVDVSALSFDKGKFLMKYLTEVQGGLVSLQPIRIAPKSLKNVNNASVYPISLSVSDTMCHAPAGMKKLVNLGAVVGIEKVDIPEEQKSDMKGLLEKDPVKFFEYASTDSVVTLMYASSMYGYNNSLPVTITSATASVMKEVMMKVLGCNSTDEFNRKYRGLQKVSHGLVPRDDRPGYVETTSLEPINDSANTIQYYASQAYHGGYNACAEVGYFPRRTWDYDLQNAYPTAMCLVPDIDWENPVRSEILRRNLDIRDWAGIGGFNPTTPFVGYVRFEFPDNVKYPCIPVNVDGIPVYPKRPSKNLDGVYVAGPYIFLALRLGATVYCERGYFLNTIITEHLKESRSLAYAVKQLVEDRNRAKIECGKKSLEELIIKTMVNSGYGKNAQNVVVKSSWTALKDSMEDLGCSAITNPVSAMMITSLVQCELLAAQNQLFERGYMACSVTTDGFISDCPEEEIKSLDLYGIRLFMEQSRIFLTGEKELWEVKHHQDDLVNFTTRGNVSLYCKTNPMVFDGKNYEGVCAHNSAKSGFANGSYEDRLWLMTQVLTRTKTVDYNDDVWCTFKELVKGKGFTTTTTVRHIRMDFDMKRKPDRNSFRTDRPMINSVEYEIAHFDTVPYEDEEEFRLYREKKDLTSCLRKEADWDIFWMKVDMNATGCKVRDMDWSILNSCIMGHRSGRWNIPRLESGTLEEKCEWINTHNTSTKKKFTPSDWKNARRPERQVNMLPVEMIQEKLDEFMNDVL